MTRALLFLLSATSVTLIGQQSENATLDRMVADGKSPGELAQYVFDTHGCKKCHTVGRDGKLGFTELGKQRATGFEGCVHLLTAVSEIVRVPEQKRSPQQREKVARFNEFGCTSCHKVSPGKLTLTEAGAKLKHLHLGCVEVEQQVAKRQTPRP